LRRHDRVQLSPALAPNAASKIILSIPPPTRCRWLPVSLVCATCTKEFNMKALLVASVLSSVLASAAVAATVTVPDNSTTLAGVASAATALLLDAGLKPRNAGGGVLAVGAKNFHCDQLLNTATEALSMHAGLPTVKCRTNSPNKRGASAGPLFNDGRTMVELLQKVQGAGGAVFSDCAMGYCGIFAKSIKCTIDTKIDNYNNGGRWSCAFVDGQ